MQSFWHFDSAGVRNRSGVTCCAKSVGEDEAFLSAANGVELGAMTVSAITAEIAKLAFIVASVG
jgi:hypothetical protein